MADTTQTNETSKNGAGENGKFIGKNKDVVFFGKTDFRNTERLFGVKRGDRRQHMYVIGKTGTGKSALLKNLAVQDIYNGDGICIVDPHGEFVEEIITNIPSHRLDDVIYFNPADTEHPMGFNILELPDPKYKNLVASGLMGIFTKIWANVWSDRMEYILNNSILALLDTPNSTLLGIPRLLVDKNYRQKIVNNIKDPVVKAFWVHEYEGWQERYRNEAIAAVINKVGQFLSSNVIRNVVGQPKSSIDIFKIMNERKILLINVSKGRIGEDNSSLLGAMFITKIQLSAMERVRIPEAERKDFFLYVDEFQNFATSSFAGILSEARKYRLNILLAHQYVGQLVTETSTVVRDAVFGNVGTMIIFRVGASDAEFLENELTPEFTIQDIVNLPNYSIYLKLMIDGITSRPFSAQTLPPINLQLKEDTREKIIESSRKSYGRPRAQVERAIEEWSGMSVGSYENTSEPKRMRDSKDSKLYEATCDNCGKIARVPFKPTPGKPVLCKDCFDKAHAGKPAPRGERPTTESRGHISELANLGIEFEVRKATRGVAENIVKPESKESLRKTISLSELKEVQKEEHGKTQDQTDKSTLRNILKQTLEGNTREEK